MTEDPTPSRFHTDESFAEVVQALRKTGKLKSHRDVRWFEKFQPILREEIEELLATIHAQLNPKDGYDKAFAKRAALAKRKAAKKKKGGRPTQKGAICTTAVVALAHLYESVARPRGGIWRIPAAERSHFAKFIHAALSPLDDDYLTENAVTRWDDARKIIKPNKNLRALGLPSKIRLRIADYPDEHGSTAACEEPKRKRRKSILRPK